MEVRRRSREEGGGARAGASRLRLRLAHLLLTGVAVGPEQAEEERAGVLRLGGGEEARAERKVLTRAQAAAKGVESRTRQSEGWVLVWAAIGAVGRSAGGQSELRASSGELRASYGRAPGELRRDDAR